MTQPGSPPNDSPFSDDRDPESDGGNRSSDATSGDSSSTGKGDDSYRRIRDDFDGLDLEHQATFLVDATVSLLAKGIETAGRALADEVDGFVERQRKKAAEKKGASDVPQRPDPPTAANEDNATREDTAAENTAADDVAPSAGDDTDASPDASPDASTDAPPSASDDEEDEREEGPGDLPPRGPLG